MTCAEYKQARHIVSQARLAKVMRAQFKNSCCPVCEETFARTSPTQRFCSYGCKKFWHGEGVWPKR